MTAVNYQQVSIFINEGDEWQHKPLHLQLLNMLHREGLAGGTVIRGVAGFTRIDGVHSNNLVDAGGKLPLVVQFIESEDEIARVLPIIREMTMTRLITLQNVRLVPQESVGQSSTN